MEYSLLLKEKFTGSTTKWEVSNGIETENIDKNSFSLNTINRIAIIGMIGYKKEISEGWFIQPQFSIIAGITKELQLYKPARTFKYLFEIGVSKRIKG